MNFKFFVTLLFSLLWINTCFSDPIHEIYYWQHPDELIKALAECPKEMDANVSCQDISKIKTSFDFYTHNLQLNPQQFGKEILALQEEIAEQQKALKVNPNSEVLKANLNKNQNELARRLAIVKWLESPEGT